MKRHIESTKLNKKLEAMGLESSIMKQLNETQHITLDVIAMRSSLLDNPRYDLLDLLEPENAKKLWGELPIHGLIAHTIPDGERLSQLNITMVYFMFMSMILLQKYQSGEDWEAWLERELEDDE